MTSVGHWIAPIWSCTLQPTIERVAAILRHARATLAGTANEPGSPVPLLLRRAQRLVTMDFVAAMKELMPDAEDKVKDLVKGFAGPQPT